MPVTFIKGTGAPRLIRAGGIRIDKYGLATGTAVWWAFDHGVLLASNAAYIGSSHPNAPSLYCENLDFANSDSGSTLTANYAGVLAGDMPAPIDELETGVMEVPIEAHPDFVTFAGTPTAPLNGAKWTESTPREFLGFIDPTTPVGFRGVTSFEVPTSISRRTTITTLAPDAADVGLRRTPYNTFGVPGNWLLIGCSSQKRGNVYVTRYEWKASGSLGWNTSIYGT